MSPLTTRLMATVVTLAVSRPLFAQAAPEAQTESGIIVTPDRAKDEEAMQGLARQVTGRLPFDRPIARFQQPMCLAIAG